MGNRVWKHGAAGLVVGASALLGCSSPPAEPPICFVRGTRVRTPSGTTPIEKLAVGDEVLSVVESTMALVVRRVTALHRAHVRRTRTITAAGRRVVTTDEHPFWDAERRVWTRAGDLTVGSVLAVVAKGRLVPAIVESTTREEHDLVEVFNLTVEGPEHTYLAEDVAVHNKSVPMDDLPPVATLGNGIKIQNRTKRAFELHVVPIGSDAAVHVDLLRSPDRLAIPAYHYLPASTTPLMLPAGQARIVESGTLRVTDDHGSPQLRAATAVDVVGGPKALLVGNGVVTLDEDGSVTRFASSSTQIAPLGAWPPRCDDSRTAIAVPSILPSDIGRHFVLDAPGTTDACLTVSAQPAPEEPSVKPLTIRICGVASLWPFAAGDVVTLERTKLLEDAPEGIRLVRDTDAKALELARLTQQSTHLRQAGHRLLVSEDNSCAIPGDEPCGTLTLPVTVVDQSSRERIYPETALPLADGTGRVHVLGGTRSLFSANCAEKVRVTVDVLAVSEP